MSLLHEELSQKVIQAFFNVYKELGYGFLERVYENALLHELSLQGLNAKKQQVVDVYYKGKNVGNYFADIVVENKIILELKACPLILEHEFQLLNYLKSTNIELGFLLSFGKKPKFKRKIFENNRKKIRDS